jgi:hypothetical protein
MNNENLTPSQKAANKIKVKLKRLQEIDDHKAFIGKNNVKQPPIAGRSKRRLPSFTF